MEKIKNALFAQDVIKILQSPKPDRSDLMMGERHVVVRQVKERRKNMPLWHEMSLEEWRGINPDNIGALLGSGGTRGASFDVENSWMKHRNDYTVSQSRVSPHVRRKRLL